MPGAVAGEDRIVVTRRAFPMSDHVPEQAFERRPARRCRVGEGVEHVAQQRNDGCRAGEPYLRIADFQRSRGLALGGGRARLEPARTDLQSRGR
jgi:hypothetical protein